MFEQFKNLIYFKQLQKEIEKEKAELEKEGIKVIIKGNMEIEEIKLNPQLNQEKQEKILKDLINQAYKQIQVKIANKVLKTS